jgi:hypothetical protein
MQFVSLCSNNAVQRPLGVWKLAYRETIEAEIGQRAAKQRQDKENVAGEGVT